jgi:hypothetical protein
MPDERAPIPHFPGGPDPALPIPREPVHGVDLARYAQISATLAERREPRAEVLRAQQLDEMRWLEVEQTWLLRIASAAMRGDLSLGQELDRAYAEAQASLGTLEPTRPLDRYAALRARVEAGESPSAVAASDGLSLSDWMRLERAWTSRIVQDPALAAAFRERVAAELGSTAGGGADVSGLSPGHG